MDEGQNEDNIQTQFKLVNPDMTYAENQNIISGQNHIIIGCPLCEEIFNSQEDVDTHMKHQHLHDVSLLYEEMNKTKKVLPKNIDEKEENETVSNRVKQEILRMDVGITGISVCGVEVAKQSISHSNNSAPHKHRELRPIAPRPESLPNNNNPNSVNLDLSQSCNHPISVLHNPVVNSVRSIAIKPSPIILAPSGNSCTTGVSDSHSIQQTINSVVLNAVNCSAKPANSCIIPITVKGVSNKHPKKSAQVFSAPKDAPTNIILTDLNPEWIKIDKEKRASVVVNGNKIAHSLGPLKLINLEEVKLNDVVMNRLCHGPVILEPVPDKNHTALGKEGYLSNSLNFESVTSNRIKLPVSKKFDSGPIRIKATRGRMKRQRGRPRRKIKTKEGMNGIFTNCNNTDEIPEREELIESTIEIASDEICTLMSNDLDEVIEDEHNEIELNKADLNEDQKILSFLKS